MVDDVGPFPLPAPALRLVLMGDSDTVDTRPLEPLLNLNPLDPVDPRREPWQEIHENYGRLGVRRL